MKDAGEQLFNQAVNAAGNYIANAINETLFVKKQTDHPRILPSMEHMKIVSICVLMTQHSSDLIPYHIIYIWIAES